MSKNGRIPAVFFVAVLTVLQTVIGSGACVWAQAAESETSPQIEELMDRLFPPGDAEAKQLEQMEVKFSGPAERPELYEVLTLTKRSNPLLTENCRKEAANIAVSALAEAKDLQEIEAVHMAAQHVSEKQAFVTENGISYADYFKHIIECKEFCRPLVAHLISCHVLAVANHEHGIVLFDYDSDHIKSDYASGLIEEIAQRLGRDPGLRVLVVGRASRTGKLRYNRALSGRRALAVEDQLVAKGIGPARIRSMWFGWEEPQINEWIAEEYGLEREFREYDQLQMNQSVVMVLY